MQKGGKIAATAAAAAASAPISYVAQRALASWGVLDGFSDALGKFLKMHVSAAQAGWTVTVIIFAILYVAALWVIWHKRKPETVAALDEPAVPAARVIEAPPAPVQQERVDELAHQPAVSEEEARRAARLDRLLLEDRLRKASVLATELRRHILPVPENPSNNRHHGIVPGLSGNNYRARLDSIGINWDERNERVQHAHAAIRADALYCTLDAGDEGHFANGADKQAWYLFNSTWEADLSLLREKRLI